MARIGVFTATANGYSGRLQTLTLDVELTLVPADAGDGENAPDYRIHRGAEPDGPEVGAAGSAPARRPATIISLLIDDPAFSQPIRANLFQAERERIGLQSALAPSEPSALSGLDRDANLSIAPAPDRRLRRHCRRCAEPSQSLSWRRHRSSSRRRRLLRQPPMRRAVLRSVAAVADPFAAFVAEAAQRFGIPASWIRAIMHAESREDPRAVSPKGAMGLMQIMPSTWANLRARHRLGANPFDPHDNILAGAAFLRELHDRYGSPGFLAAYNAGPGRYEDHLATGRPLPAETRAYVAAIAPLIGEGQLMTRSRSHRSRVPGPRRRSLSGKNNSAPTVDQSTHPVQPNPPAKRPTRRRCVGPRAAFRQPLRAGFSAGSRTMSQRRSLCGVSERSDGLGLGGAVSGQHDRTTAR